MSVCMLNCIYSRINLCWVYVQANECVCVCVATGSFKYADICIRECVCVCVRVYIYAHAYLCIYVRICIILLHLVLVGQRLKIL